MRSAWSWAVEIRGGLSTRDTSSRGHGSSAWLDRAGHDRPAADPPALRFGITTETYDNGSYIVALMRAGAAVLALFPQSGGTPPSTERGHVEL
ncbi:hypothetical protein GCM10023320_11730 [Pseudonocardia adelaidensis]|uniref:Uncharacterized protein n=1 Tax=Pseudonocardia adelaidensis TaxID=648754 RepID=A0ABP9NEJ6_9PSEU